MAPYVIVDRAQELIKLGSLDPLMAGPITDAGSTSYHAVKRVLPKLDPGSTAIVIGAGGLGAFAVQYLKVLSPTRIIVIDSSAARRAYAVELGADQCFEALDHRTVEAVRDLTQGYGAEAVLDFVGIDQSIETGLMLTRWFGSFALIGAGGGAFRKPLMAALPREAEIFTFLGGSRSDTLAAITLAEQGKISVDVEIFTLSQAADAYSKMERGELRGRAVVQPGIW
jgi:propanol-preferring alcohol dehydrogenase